MKILYVIDKMSNHAGIERILTCKMNYISEHTTHNVCLMTYEQGSMQIPFSLDDSITHHPIETPIPPRNELTLPRWLKEHYHTRVLFKHEFKSLLNIIHPDIVVFTVYSYQLLDIIINTSYHLGIKTIMESHTKGETVTIAHKFKYNPKLYRLFSLWDHHIMKSLRYCSCVVTLTKQDITFWQKYTQRIEVIPNMLTIIPQKVLNYEAKRVFSAGRYMSEKGFDRLLKAWHLLYRDFNDWHLYIFGDGNRKPYQQIVDKYQMNDSVHLMSATEDIAKEFSKSSIYVMSSRYEGFGLVLAEAMSCGLPCISFDCPYGPREIITDGEDGLLAENGNVEVLAQKMKQLMSDANLRKTMGTKAINNIARYQPKIIMAQWLNLFQSI